MRALIIIALLLVNELSAQHLIDYSVEEINWQEWDLFHGDTIARANFMNNFYIENPDSTKSAKPIVPSKVKVLDIDGDGIKDMLYVESGRFWMYINKGDTLQIINSFDEQIIEVFRNWPDSPLTFKTADIHCCEEGEWEFKYYHYFFKNNVFQYQVYRTEIIAKGAKDLFRNMPPVHINVGVASADLVLAPGSTTVIRSYQSGRSGYATASMKDDKNKLWWKVFIKEKDYKLRTGWMERNNLVTLYQQN